MMKVFIFLILFNVVAIYFGWWEDKDTTITIFMVAFLFAIVRMEWRIQQLENKLKGESTTKEENL